MEMVDTVVQREGNLLVEMAVMRWDCGVLVAATADALPWVVFAVFAVVMKEGVVDSSYMVEGAEGGGNGGEVMEMVGLVVGREQVGVACGCC